MEECCHALAGMDFGFAVSTNKNAPAQVCRGVNFNYIIRWFPACLLPEMCIRDRDREYTGQK